MSLLLFGKIVAMKTNRFLTSAELAQRWRVEIETIRKWIRAGTVPYVQIGRRKLIPESVLQQLEQLEQPRQDSPLQPTTTPKGGC